MQRFRELLFTLLLAMLVAGGAQAQDDSEWIAYVGGDGNVYLFDLNANTQISVTDDAANDGLLRYRMPVWATDGRLAYFRETVAQGTVMLDVLVADDGQPPSRLLYNAPDRILNYAHWSPQNCAENDTCRDLALLLSDPDSDTQGLRLDVVRDLGDDARLWNAGRGIPFFFSWSPDGTRMVWNRAGSSLDLYDVEQNAITDTLTLIPGVFQAPGWSPVDDRLLLGGQQGTGTDLVIVANGDSQTLVDGIDGALAFSWSPNGDEVAYLADGVLSVVDAVTGEVVYRSGSRDPVIAFFWSPDSRQIAAITSIGVSGGLSAKRTAQIAPDMPHLAWSVIHVQSGDVRQYGVFVPTADMLYVITYFDQFAQSHHLWSSDSRYLLYGELLSGGGAGLSIIDTTRTDAVPLTIADGIIGFWSH